MTVVFDSDFFSLLLYPWIDPPDDPETGLPVERASDRISRLVSQLDATNAGIVVPAPALSEFLVVAGAQAAQYISTIQQQAAIRIEPFDTVAAVEAAASTHAAIERGDKKSGATGKWQCVKTDRQIVAVGKQHGATHIYSNDRDMRHIAAASGLNVVAVWELPIPPPADQVLPFGSHH